MKQRYFLLVLIIILSVLLCGCSMPFNNNKAGVPKPVVTPTPRPTTNEEIDEANNVEENNPLQEIADNANEIFASMTDEEKKEEGLEGVNISFEPKDENTLIMKIAEDGVAGLVYRASHGDSDALKEYDEYLITMRDGLPAFEKAIIEQVNDDNVKLNGVEFWLMNDVNQDNKLVIIKNSQVVYDTVYEINLLDLGSTDK